MPNIEEQIQRAIREGKFDDLAGKGKPMRLDQEDPYADPEWQLAYHLLRQSGFTLPWIERRQEILTAIDQARQTLHRAWECRQAAAPQAREQSLAEEQWRCALDNFRAQLPNLNRRILDYNLSAPSERFHLTPLKLELELKRLQRVAGH